MLKPWEMARARRHPEAKPLSSGWILLADRNSCGNTVYLRVGRDYGNFGRKTINYMS